MAAADQSLEAAESWLITGVLCAALLFGLIGLAAHFLWIVAIIIIMALGLGYIVANSRRDRIDVINQQADEHPGPPRAALTGRTDSKRHAPRGAWRRVIQLEVAI